MCAKQKNVVKDIFIDIYSTYELFLEFMQKLSVLQQENICSCGMKINVGPVLTKLSISLTRRVLYFEMPYCPLR